MSFKEDSHRGLIIMACYVKLASEMYLYMLVASNVYDVYILLAGVALFATWYTVHKLGNHFHNILAFFVMYPVLFVSLVDDWSAVEIPYGVSALCILPVVIKQLQEYRRRISV